MFLGRYLIDQGGWHSLGQPAFHKIEDVFLIASASFTSDPSPLDPRMLRPFLVLHALR